MRPALLLLFAIACGSGDVRVRKDVTAAGCHTSSDCPDGRSCSRGICEDVNPTVRCYADSECPSGQACVSGYCETPQSAPQTPPVRR